MTGWVVPIEHQKEYLAACEQAATDDSLFKSFRQHPALHRVWGHIHRQDGQDYLDAILKAGFIPKWSMMDLVEMNDIGNPTTENFDGVTVSPTMFRYLYVISELIDLRLSAPLSVIEVGGGYGGLAATAFKFLDIEDYTIIDFHETCMLQNRFLNECDVKNVTTLRSETFECHLNDRYDLFISNYAFDEFSNETQDRYMRVVNRCSHGYVTVARNKDRVRNMLPTTRQYPEPWHCHPEVMRW